MLHLDACCVDTALALSPVLDVPSLLVPLKLSSQAYACIAPHQHISAELIILAHQASGKASGTPSGPAKGIEKTVKGKEAVVGVSETWSEVGKYTGSKGPDLLADVPSYTAARAPTDNICMAVESYGTEHVDGGDLYFAYLNDQHAVEEFCCRGNRLSKYEQHRCWWRPCSCLGCIPSLAGSAWPDLCRSLSKS